jgi:hypothetical protein
MKESKHWAMVEKVGSVYVKGHFYIGHRWFMQFNLPPGLRLQNGTLEKYVGDEAHSIGFELTGFSSWSPHVLNMREKRQRKKKR